LGGLRFFEKELDAGGEQLQLDRGVFVLKVVQEGLKQIPSVLNALCSQMAAAGPHRATQHRKEKKRTSGQCHSKCSEAAHSPAYSPIIQIIEALASGSSRVSRFSHSVEIIDSYLVAQREGQRRSQSWVPITHLLGYLRNMSLMTMIASWTT